jgi:hypothetical protein
MQIFEASAKIGTGVPEVFQCCAIGSPILARAAQHSQLRLRIKAVNTILP